MCWMNWGDQEGDSSPNLTYSSISPPLYNLPLSYLVHLMVNTVHSSDTVTNHYIQVL